MPLIIYPAANSDSFVTVPQADLYISMLTLNSAEWTANTNEEKEILLRIAYRTILDGIDLVANPLPDPIPVCVPEAQALIAVHDTVNSISGGVTSTTTQGAIKKQKVGSLEQQFYDTKTTGGATGRVYVVPKSAMKCLESIGYVFAQTSDKFTQKRLGRM